MFILQYLFAIDANFLVYFYCFAFQLKLILEQKIENILTLKSVLETIGNFCRFMEGYLKRHSIHKTRFSAKRITSGKTTLHSLSDKRWSSRSDNLNCIVNVYFALLSMFQQMFKESKNGMATS